MEEIPDKDTTRKGSKYRHWRWTWNNPPEPYGELVFGSSVKFCIYQLEEAPTTGTIHYQGHLSFTNPVQWKTAKATISGKCRILKADFLDKSIAYCEKSESKVAGLNSGPWEYGTRPRGQGTRSDLMVLKEAADSGKSERWVAENHFCVWAKHYRAFSRYCRLIRDPRDFQTETIVYWGPSGSGKSSHVFELAGGVATAHWVQRPRTRDGGVWWDGYEGQPATVFDDFYGWVPRSEMQVLCDRYPLLRETKGGMVQFVSRRVFITSNVPPEQWWSKLGLGAMGRRLEPPLGYVFYVSGNTGISEAEYRAGGCGRKVEGEAVAPGFIRSSAPEAKRQKL